MDWIPITAMAIFVISMLVIVWKGTLVSRKK